MAKDDTARELVRAAVELLVEDGGQIVDRGLRWEEATRRAHLSHTTFFRNFRKSEFIDAVMAALVPTENRPFAQALSNKIESALYTGDGDPRQTVRDVANWDFLAVREDSTTIRQLLGLSLGRSRPATMANLHALYANYDAANQAAYRILFERWGATLRAPFTVKLLAVSLTAMVEGLTLRWYADPDAVPDGLLGEMVLAFVTTIIDTHQRHEHIDDAAAPLAADIMSMFQAASGENLPDDPRRAIVDAARSELRRHGFLMTTLEMISATARVPLATTKRLYPTKTFLIVSALRDPYRRLAEAIEDDLTTFGKSEVEVIERHLLRLAQLTHDEPAFTEALIMAVMHDTHGEPDGSVSIKQELNLPGLIEPVVRQGQANGVFVRSQPAIDIAAALTNGLFIRCFTRRGRTPQEHADRIADLVLRGAQLR